MRRGTPGPGDVSVPAHTPEQALCPLGVKVALEPSHKPHARLCLHLLAPPHAPPLVAPPLAAPLKLM